MFNTVITNTANVSFFFNDGKDRHEIEPGKHKYSRIDPELKFNIENNFKPFIKVTIDEKFNEFKNENPDQYYTKKSMAEKMLDGTFDLPDTAVIKDDEDIINIEKNFSELNPFDIDYDNFATDLNIDIFVKELNTDDEFIEVMSKPKNTQETETIEIDGDTVEVENLDTVDIIESNNQKVDKEEEEVLVKPKVLPKKTINKLV